MKPNLRALRDSVLRLSAVSALTLLCPIAFGANSAEGPTGRVSQPIIVGDLVSLAQQEELGLVTVAGGCSGTLLNQYWVLTADHCLTNPVAAGGAARPIEQITITAAWRKGTVTPTRSVRYYTSNRLDVALLFLGHGDFGPRKPQLIYHNTVDTSMKLAKFGRGLSSYATSTRTGVWTPGLADGRYRTAVFTPNFANANDIVVPTNDRGQVASGGDSGGADYVTGAGGALLSIASVQSSCRATGYLGAAREWQWATGIRDCTSAALVTLRDDIVRHMQEKPLDIQIDARRPHLPTTLPDPNAPVSHRYGSAAATATAATCKPGYVWREARPQDLVCVTPAARGHSALENRYGSRYVDPAGAYGPNSCKAGFVWREAFAGDVVCVTPEARNRVAQENRVGPSLRAGA